MQQVNLPNLGTNWHTLKMGFFSNRIAVYVDGIQRISMPDLENGPFLSGGISLEMWSDTTRYLLNVDDVLVRPLAVDDSYTGSANVPLVVASPGVLGNDTGVYGTNLTATLLSSPVHGTITLSAHGGFTYTPSTDFVGTDTFTYQASDDVTNLGAEP